LHRRRAIEKDQYIILSFAALVLQVETVSKAGVIGGEIEMWGAARRAGIPHRLDWRETQVS
jgi:hypothetical protein